MADDPQEITIEVLRSIRDEVSGLRTELRDEVSGLRTELRGQVSGLRTELRGEVSGLRTELRDEVSGLRTELGETNTRLERVEARQISSETRIATEIIAVAGAVNALHETFKASLQVQGQVADHEKRIVALERSTRRRRR